MCGVQITFGSPTSGEFFGGSSTKTSSAAPAKRPLFSASAKVIHATDPNGVAGQVTVTVTTAVNHFVVTAPTTVTEGDPFSITITAQELDADDRPIYVRMLESYERGGPAGLEADMAGYPSEEQDLIRRAWAAPPPNVEDEVAMELAERIRLEHMKGMHSGIIRELSEAERGRDSERVVRLETEAREIARAIKDMERRG